MENKITQTPMQIECKPLQKETGEEVYVIELPVESYRTREVIPIHERVIREEQAYFENTPSILAELILLLGQITSWILSWGIRLIIEVVRVVVGIACTALGHTLVALGQYAFGLMSRKPTSKREQVGQDVGQDKRQHINIVNINQNNINP